MFAMAEVSRHMPDLRRLAKAEFPDIDFDDLYFVVDFSTAPPTLRLETMDSIDEEVFERVVEDLLQRQRSYDRNRVGLLRIEALMDFGAADEEPVYRLVELDKTGPKNAHLAAVLEAGKALGGVRRQPCFLESKEQPRLEAEYDIIDEITRCADERMEGRPLLCHSEYSAIIEEEAKSLMQEIGGDLSYVIYV